MKRTITIATLAVAATVAVTGSAQSDGTIDEPRLDTDRTPQKVEFHAEPAPAGKGGGPSIKFYATDTINLAPDESIFIKGPCPGDNAKAIDGGFASNGFVVSDFLAPIRKDKYGYGVFEASGQPGGKVMFTLTCSKGNG